MSYESELEERNRELIRSGATLDSMKDLFRMQLNTEKMRLSKELLEAGEETTRELEAIKEDVQLHQELIDMGDQQSSGVDQFRNKLAEVVSKRQSLVQAIEWRQQELDAKLDVIEEPEFLSALVSGQLGDTLEVAFRAYARKYLTPGAAQLSAFDN